MSSIFVVLHESWDNTVPVYVNPSSIDAVSGEFKEGPAYVELRGGGQLNVSETREEVVAAVEAWYAS